MCWDEQWNTVTSQPITTRHKICEFFEKHKAICITTGILCLPLGIAYATIYGVAKALDKHQKYISSREATECSDNQRTNDTESSSSLNQINKTPFAESTTTINSEIEKIEEQYKQYAKNPQDENIKQDMIKALKNSNPCAVYQFLVEIFSSTGHLPQNFVEMLKNNGLTAYEMFTKIDKTRTSDMIDIINAIRTILTDPNNSELSMNQLSFWFSLDNRYNSITLLVCNAFTNKELEIICNYKETSDQFRILAYDFITLRSYIKEIPTSAMTPLKYICQYNPSQLADSLRENHTNASLDCSNFFDQLNKWTGNDDRQCALQILIEQELMTRNKN